METKKYLTSKTIWFNVMIAVFTVLSGNVELLREYMSSGGYMIVLMLVSGGGVYLRSVTTTGISK
jgi:hypothetical protein